MMRTASVSTTRRIALIVARLERGEGVASAGPEDLRAVATGAVAAAGVGGAAVVADGAAPDSPRG